MNLSASLRSRWPLLAPLATTLVIALLPIPAGLPPHAWYFFAIFMGSF